MFRPFIFTSQELDSSASRIQGKLTLSQENEMRRSYEEFLRVAGLKLRLPRSTIAVATIYLHVVFHRFPITDIDQPSILIQSILYLACKSEETHRRLHDLIIVVQDMQDGKYCTINPPNRVTTQSLKSEMEEGEEDDEEGSVIEGKWRNRNSNSIDEYSNIRSLILVNEQLVLRMLGFNLHVDLSYPYMYNYLKSLDADIPLIKTSTSILNDMYCSSIVIEYKPNELACGAIYIAAKWFQATSTQGQEENRKRWRKWDKKEGHHIYGNIENKGKKTEIIEEGSLPSIPLLPPWLCMTSDGVLNYPWYLTFDVELETLLAIAKKAIQIYSLPQVNPLYRKREKA